MTRQETQLLKPGDRVVVQYGWKGTQVAEVLGYATPIGRVPVKKWRKNSARWTKRVYVNHNEILSVSRGQEKP